ncbi:MAG: deoxyribonuclease IV [Patescibacteria group bacterium]
MILGAHISVAGGIINAFKGTLDLDASALQIFAKSPMQSKLNEISEEEGSQIMTMNGRQKIKAVVIHASYLLNLAKPLSDGGYEIKSIAEDLLNAERIGAIGVVLHMGKSLKEDLSTSKKLFADNVNRVLDKTAKLKTKLILENTAGQGTEFGYKIEEFAEIMDLIGRSERLGACIDTAHLMGAGYDLAIEKEATATAVMISELIGIKHISCVHFNDSKKPSGSHVDRHEDIGEGTIGEAGLASFAKKLRKENHTIPFILETPQTKLTYREQMDRIMTWKI